MKEGNFLKKLLKNRGFSLTLIVLGMFILLSVTTDSFFNMNNILNLLRQCAITCVLACGMTFIISGGGIDLSLADNMVLASLFSAMILASTGSDILAIIIAILTGVVVGALNGIMVTKIGLAPFIVTMGMSNICKGIALGLTKGYPVQIPADSFVFFIGQRSVAGIPCLIFCIPIFVIIGSVVLNKTVLGNRLQAVGGNINAAALSGLNVTRLRVLTYMIGGAFAAFAGVMLTGRLNAGNPSAAGTLGMDAIAATVVGGTSMAGGSGTIIGTLLGSLLMQMIKNGLVQLEVSIYWQTTVIGIVLIVVCALDALGRKKQS